MTHSLIGADRGTHCKIAALALAGPTLVMVAIAARVAPSNTPTARALADGPVVRAGKPAISARLDAKTIR